MNKACQVQSDFNVVFRWIDLIKNNDSVAALQTTIDLLQSQTQETDTTNPHKHALKLEKKNQEAKYIEINKNTQMQIEQNLIQFTKKNVFIYIFFVFL